MKSLERQADLIRSRDVEQMFKPFALRYKAPTRLATKDGVRELNADAKRLDLMRCVHRIPYGYSLTNRGCKPCGLFNPLKKYIG